MPDIHGKPIHSLQEATNFVSILDIRSPPHHCSFQRPLMVGLSQSVTNPLLKWTRWRWLKCKRICQVIVHVAGHETVDNINWNWKNYGGVVLR